MGVLSSLGCSFGAAYEKYEFTLQGHQCMMRDDANDLAALCCQSSEYMQRFSQDGPERQELVAMASGLVLKEVLGVTSNLTALDLHP